VTQTRIKKIAVKRNERRPIQQMQQRDDFLISHPLATDIDAYLAK
jgi:hypothetical protein